MHVPSESCTFRPMSAPGPVDANDALSSARRRGVGALQRWMPPAVYDRLRGTFGSVSWSGEHVSWADALAVCGGYDAPALLARAQRAATAVKEGRAAYERDAILFHEPRPAWPVLASLLWIASASDGRLRVLDYGGALGSTYQQHKAYFGGLREVRWDIVEQEHFAACGARQFTDSVLHFHADVESCLRTGLPDVVLLSSILPYVEAPYSVLDTLLSHAPPFLLVDRTPFISGARDRLTVQRTRGHLGAASYPAWFFSREKLDRYLEGRYRLVEQFESSDRANVPSQYRGLLLQRVGGNPRAR